ncbi:MAG: ABC transporter permease [Gemmatimonadaceae bacterium]
MGQAGALGGARTPLLILPALGLLAVALQASAQRPQDAPRNIAGQRPQDALRNIAIDQQLAADASLSVGDRVVLAAAPGAAGDTVVVAAIVRSRADPSEVPRAEYRVRLHLDHLQQLAGYGDRVDRFAIRTRGDSATSRAMRAINAAAFGFRAHRSRDIAVETSKTFLVVSRFHKAIGVITIVASATFLLCIMLLKVDERRRDVAALRLMGISAATVVRSVVLEASLVAVLGSALGAALGWAASGIVNWHYQGVYRTSLAFSVVTGDVLVLAVALSLVLGVVAGLLAALRLVRTPPLVLFGR